ncbi:hypothetical protein ABH521_003600 [Staphylococcus warneri]|uniref:hypothetical protein n=1 Tax=Staphylococcus warneri TaxID=1292 RepID=UPI003260F778
MDMNFELVKQTIDDENARMGDNLEYLFSYKGYTAMIKRYDQYEHLCGYLKLNVTDSDERFEIIGMNAHGGITYNRGGWVGFDCNHYLDLNLAFYMLAEEKGLDDIYPMIMGESTYKDLEFVKSNLQRIIDELVKAGY